MERQYYQAKEVGKTALILSPISFCSFSCSNQAAIAWAKYYKILFNHHEWPVRDCCSTDNSILTITENRRQKVQATVVEKDTTHVPVKKTLQEASWMAHHQHHPHKRQTTINSYNSVTLTKLDYSTTPDLNVMPRQLDACFFFFFFPHHDLKYLQNNFEESKMVCIIQRAKIYRLQGCFCYCFFLFFFEILKTTKLSSDKDFFPSNIYTWSLKSKTYTIIIYEIKHSCWSYFFFKVFS